MVRESIPLRKITPEEIWAEVQRLRSELQTHNHLTAGSQLLTGEVSGIIQSTNYEYQVAGWRLTNNSFEMAGGIITGGTFQTAISGARTVITGNDIYFYDDTTGGTDPSNRIVIGDSASIYFPRTDDVTQRYIIRKRSGFENDDDNVLEQFFDKDSNNSRYNYIFNGRSGTQLPDEGHATYNVHSTLDRFDIDHGNSGVPQFLMCKSDTPTDAVWGNGLSGGIRTHYLFQDMGTAMVFTGDPDFTLGEVIVGGTSGAFGFVGTKTDINNYIVVAIEGTFLDGETVTGSTSENSGTLSSWTSTAFNPADFSGGGVLMLGHIVTYAGSKAIMGQMWFDSYNIWVADDFIPAASNSYALGNSTYLFKEIWIGTAPTDDNQATTKEYVDHSTTTTKIAGEILEIADAVYLSTGGLTATKKVENTTGDTPGSIFGARWGCQTFGLFITEELTITKINLELKKQGTPIGNITVEIYATDAGKPTGPVLASSVLVADDAIGAAYGLIEFVLDSPVDRDAGEAHAIVLKCPNTDMTNRVEWRFANSGNPYAGGTFVYSENSGVDWVVDLTFDFRFDVYTKPKADRVYKTDASFNDERITAFLGFVTEGKNAGETITIKTAGKVAGFTGLSVGNRCFLSDTAGEISSSAGTYIKRVGYVASTTEIVIDRYRYLGDWEVLVIDTIYQAPYDGFVTAWFIGNAEGTVPRLTSISIIGYTDGSTPPTTIRTQDASNFKDGTTGTLTSGISFPVKKGDYWKVVGSRSGGASETSGICFIPLVQSLI